MGRIAARRAAVGIPACDSSQSRRRKHEREGGPARFREGSASADSPRASSTSCSIGRPAARPKATRRRRRRRHRCASTGRRAVLTWSRRCPSRYQMNVTALEATHESTMPIPTPIACDGRPSGSPSRQSGHRPQRGAVAAIAGRHEPGARRRGCRDRCQPQSC